jgi:acyl-CoA synthetase (AMP-forming)/AMP-acid ligase II
MNAQENAVTGRLDEVIRSHPDDVAYWFKGAAQSYAELGRWVSKAASGLARLGVEPGDRVAVMLRNCPEYFGLSYAIWRAGAVLVPVNVLLSAEEVAHVLGDSGARVVVVGGDLAATVALARSHSSGLTTVVAGDPAADYGDCTLDELVAAGSAEFAARAPARDRLAIIAYTSGTTGFPKGAMLDDRHLYEQMAAIQEHFGLANADNFAQFFPVHSVAPDLIGGWITAYVGSACVLMERFAVAELAKLVAAHHVTCFAMVPTMLLDLLRYRFDAAPDLSSIRYIQVGGAAVPDQLRQELWARYGIPLIKSYGSTECSYVSLDFPGVEPLPLTSGQVLSHIELTARGLDGEVLPIGEVGELCVGPKAGHERPFRPILGYWHDPEKSAAALADGVFHTGDIGRVDQHGWVYVVDRLKDMIIRGGNNIYPAELERVVRADPRVDDVYVVGVRDERLGEIPKAYIVPSDKVGAATASDIAATANEQLARFKRIELAEFTSSADLPRNAMNKVVKSRLAERANAERANAARG